jgi:hypothetical protein
VPFDTTRKEKAVVATWKRRANWKVLPPDIQIVALYQWPFVAACRHMLQKPASTLPCRQPGLNQPLFGGWKDARVPGAGFHLRRGTWLV